jgi:uncharacterized protein YhbP (UPF0306 family)
MTDTTADLVMRLIQTQRTLVLATVDPEPWSAPVYYVYQRKRFYFFSGKGSRHVSAALASGQCAGAIFRDSDDWQGIEGLQMGGKVEAVPLGVEAIEAFRAYIKRFPTVKEFFIDAVFDFGQFLDRFRTQLHVFVPEHMFYLNNKMGLGKRHEVHLPD